MLFRFLGFQGVFFPWFSKETGRANGGIVGAQARGDAPALRRHVSVSGVQGLGSARGRGNQHQRVPGEAFPCRMENTPPRYIANNNTTDRPKCRLFEFVQRLEPPGGLFLLGFVFVRAVPSAR